MPAQRSTPATPVTPPAPPVVIDPCTCGHAKAAHEHYRDGADCGVCGRGSCAAFRAAQRSGSVRRLFRRT